MISSIGSLDNRAQPFSRKSLENAIAAMEDLRQKGGWFGEEVQRRLEIDRFLDRFTAEFYGFDKALKAMGVDLTDDH